MQVRSVKETVAVMVVVAGYRLEGEVHVSPGGRLTDEVNRETEFIPMTRVTVFTLAGQRVVALEFLTLNKRNILFMAPLEKP